MSRENCVSSTGQKRVLRDRVFEVPEANGRGDSKGAMIDIALARKGKSL